MLYAIPTLGLAFSIKPARSINFTAYDNFFFRLCGIPISLFIRREMLNCCAVEMRNELRRSQAFFGTQFRCNGYTYEVCGASTSSAALTFR